MPGPATPGLLQIELPWFGKTPVSISVPLLILACLLPARDGTKLPDQVDDGWSDGYKNDRGQNEEHEGRNHLDGGLGGLFFGPLPAFGAEGVGMHAESLRHARSKTVGLNQRAHQRTNVIDASAFHQVAESFGAGLAGTHLQIHQVKLIAQVGMGVVQILAYPHQGLIECQPSLDADYGEIKSIRQSQTDA